MKRKVEKPRRLEDGVHNGIIIDLQERTKPYKYVDLILEIDKVQFTAGYPDWLSEGSALGELAARFGAKPLIEDAILDLKQLLVGRHFTCMSLNETKDNKTYTKIIPASVKPLPAGASKVKRETIIAQSFEGVQQQQIKKAENEAANIQKEKVPKTILTEGET